MTETAIGLDPLDDQQPDDDEARARKARKDGESVENDQPQPDITREDIQVGNDRNVSADQGNRSGRTNQLPDQGIEIN